MGQPARRRVPIDWDVFDLALTWQGAERAAYLELRTGEVCDAAASGSQPEEWERFDDDVETGVAEGHLIRVEPLESSVEYEWMADFTAAVRDSRLRVRLDDALRGRGPFRRFKDVLSEHPAAREQWFTFHGAQVRQTMLEWLAEHGIEPQSPPPERPA
jgi:hypothetical protein